MDDIEKTNLVTNLCNILDFSKEKLSVIGLYRRECKKRDEKKYSNSRGNKKNNK